MNHIKRITKNMNFIIASYCAEPGQHPDEISRKVFLSGYVEKNSESEEKMVTQFIQDRKIKEVVHFTHIDDLEMILKIGLIPRIYLEEKAGTLNFGPKFNYNQSVEEDKMFKTLSISLPDYERFCKLSAGNEENWAVILFSLEPIKRHKCDFDSGEPQKTIDGIQGLKEMFADPSKRETSGLSPWLTTNPQAKILDSSAIPSSWVKEVHLTTTKHLKKVKEWSESKNVQVKVDQKFFEPRIGHKYWPSSKFEPRVDHNYWPPQELNKVHVEGIHGSAHWEFFISAIEDSKNTLFILSGWISSDVIDEQVLSLLEDAIKRGVKIYLGYGYSKPTETHRIGPKTREALRRLKNLEQRTINEKGELCRKEFKNHAKVIIVDNKYRIVGSNNWLSNRKYSNSEYSIKVSSEIETAEAQKGLAADF